MVSDLVDQNPGRFAAVTYHVFDTFVVPWGQDRYEDFYFVGATPTLMYDGWLSCPIADYAACFAQNLGLATDVTIDLSGRDVSGSTWDIGANVCVEAGGSSRSLRVYIAATLNHPDLPAYTRNVLMQEAVTVDVSVSAGTCRTVTQTITFDSVSWSNQNDITIIAWAQDPTGTGPANVHQAAIMGWPFPQGPELTTIVISPSNIELKVGESRNLTATGKDQFGGDIPLSNPVWSMTGSGDGTFSPPSGNATTEFFATQPGELQIVCTDGSVSGAASAVITVDPPVLSTVAVSPSTAEMEVGQRKPFAAVGQDQYGNVYALNDPHWHTTGDGGGTFDPPDGSTTPVFTAVTVGDVQIICTEGAISGQSSVVITGDPPHLAAIALTPQAATVVLGSSLFFTASGTDQYGDPFSMDSLVWSVSGDGHGAFDPPSGSETPTFTATAVGSSTITAAQDGIEVEASIEITDRGLPKPRRVKARHTP